MGSDVDEEGGGVGEVGREGVRGDGGEWGRDDHGKSRVNKFITITFIHIT